MFQIYKAIFERKTRKHQYSHTYVWRVLHLSVIDGKRGNYYCRWEQIWSIGHIIYRPLGPVIRVNAIFFSFIHSNISKNYDLDYKAQKFTQQPIENIFSNYITIKVNAV